MGIGLANYLTLAAIVFTVGIAGIILNHKNIIIILMSVELILLSVNQGNRSVTRLIQTGVYDHPGSSTQMKK